MKQSIEILAPAGSYEGMRAAMNAGCDAVYIGGSSFGARAYANNLDENTLLDAIDEAHIRGKKLYLTVNTLLKEKEHRGKLYGFLEKFYRQGLDAVIIQDMGVLHFIHEYFPELTIHASTQTTLTMAQGANLLKPYGVTRLVTARELSLQEIRAIRDNTDLEIETFVHGALCYCYSGQCLMSSMIGGRSGNRGRCAQPCRMTYQFYSGKKKLSSDQEKYLLSPKDINTLAYIPELMEAGINSLKIEGRMKRPEYAAMVSNLYRSYADLYLERGKEYYNDHIHSESFRRDMQKLQDLYNRGGFSEGYGKTYHGKAMMSLSRPNHSGVYVGEVETVKGSQVSIALEEDVNPQDILEIRHREEEGYEFTVKDAHSKGTLLSVNAGRRPETGEEKGKQRRDRYSNPGIQTGDKVYRTKNNRLLKELEEEYLSKNKRVGIDGILTAKKGERLKLTLTHGELQICAYGDQEVQAAQKQPMTKEKILAAIDKTGDTFYYFNSLMIDMDEEIFIPVSWLNELRRQAVGLLMEAAAGKYRRNPAEQMPHSVQEIQTLREEQPDKGSRICVSVQRKEQLEVALRYEEVSAIYADYDWLGDSAAELAQRAREAGKEFYLALPHICRLMQYERLKTDLLEIIDDDAVTGFLVKNFEEIELLQSLQYYEKQKRLLANYNMYIYNSEAKTLFEELGITHYTAPVELNYQELKELGISDCDLIVYGYQPVMVSAQCLFANTSGCRKNKQGNTGNLVDRLGKSFFVQARCNSCYNIIYNSQVLSLLKYSREIAELGPSGLRLDFTLEDGEEVRKVLSAFVTEFYQKKNGGLELTDYTTGHFKRGVE
ncbi:putative protease [Anaerotaenia torta]|uniref:U32 family peptidase n=1 Tax=Anaerotaenia torta TaxID=433293 RepID=UPI003D213A96